ncbi:MAG: SCP2 sterol-binding domain-containing protein [Methylotenera sp.]|jgi:ubiquinone biosynthesis protein UbiJ|nr:SCP2 sterol-binding domain-containing protein [Methylotenera sp.]
MFKQVSTQLLQHLIAQNSWANELLQPFAGKSVQLNIALLNTSLVILENGSLAIAGDTNVPDATITIAPSLLLRLIAKDEAAKLQIKIEGDTYLATELAKVFSNLRWDYEDDLSKLVGDVPAYKLGELGRHAVNTVKETSINLTEMLSEYWQEEKPMIAKKRHVAQFNAEVDTLRADVERLEKRLNKLAKTNAAETNSIQPVKKNVQ